MSFEPHDGDEESKLSEPMVRVLRATLLIMLAWNLTELPRAANDFADSVREMNNEHLALARVIANVTAPTDVIATNSIGAIGWLADRRVIDLSGHLTKEPNYNARTLGQELGMLKTLSEEHPQYLAMFGNEDSSAIARGIASGYLRLVRPNLYCLENSQLP
jgi:hypothetical protein